MKPLDPRLRITDPASGATAGEVAAVRALRAGRGRAEQVERLAARLQPLLDAPPAATGSSAPSGSGHAVAGSTKLGLRKLLLWLASGGLGALGWYALRPEPPRPQPERPAERAAVPSLRPTEAIAADARLPAPNERQGLAGPAPSKPARSPKARAGAGPQPDPMSGKVEAELALLGRAQAALDRTPARTLALAEQHAREHAQGVFVEEREMLRIEAELKLGRRSAAYTRAEAFVARFPGSTHLPRVRSFLRDRVRLSTDPRD